MLCRFTTCYNDCRFTTCLLFVFHRRMGTVLLLSHTVWGELAFHTLSFTGRAKYEDSISCVTRWDFMFTTSFSATPVGLVKQVLLLERLDLLLTLPSFRSRDICRLYLRLNQRYTWVVQDCKQFSYVYLRQTRTAWESGRGFRHYPCRRFNYDAVYVGYGVEGE